MPSSLLLIFAFVAVGYWAVLVRGIVLGKLGRRGMGFVIRAENPMWFWVHAAVLVVIGIGFSAALVLAWLFSL